MDIVVQISTGLPGAPGIDEQALAAKLEAIQKAVPIAYALIGWNAAAWPVRTADWLRDQGAGVYLWLPVFSGWDDLAPLVGTDGRPAEQPYRSADGERFDFGCPANPANVAATLRRFDHEYAGQRYDGVFLDKIRFPSFIDGVNSVLTCHCASCVSRFGARPELPELTGDNPLGLTAYRGLTWDFADCRVADLFAYKATAVTESIAALADGFRRRGYKIGLDLFAPFLSSFVGQDYASLLPLADFVKPMLYRRTNAPAGLPFEIDRYAAAFGGTATDAARRQTRLLELLGTPAIDAAFANREIAAAKAVAGGTKIYAGFEINRTGVAPVTPPYVEENLTGLHADGFALSWDLNSTPVDNLRAAVTVLESQR